MNIREDDLSSQATQDLLRLHLAGTGPWIRRAAIGGFMSAATLLGCARPEDSSFAAQAVRRGDDCKAIAAGSALDAYGHSVGPAEEIYDRVKRDCQAWQQREAARPNSNAPR